MPPGPTIVDVVVDDDEVVDVVGEVVDVGVVVAGTVVEEVVDDGVVAEEVVTGDVVGVAAVVTGPSVLATVGTTEAAVTATAAGTCEVKVVTAPSVVGDGRPGVSTVGRAVVDDENDDVDDPIVDDETAGAVVVTGKTSGPPGRFRANAIATVPAKTTAAVAPMTARRTRRTLIESTGSDEELTSSSEPGSSIVAPTDAITFDRSATGAATIGTILKSLSGAIKAALFRSQTSQESIWRRYPLSYERVVVAIPIGK